jgi:hypothetical protein
VARFGSTVTRTYEIGLHEWRPTRAYRARLSPVLPSQKSRSLAFHPSTKTKYCIAQTDDLINRREALSKETERMGAVATKDPKYYLEFERTSVPTLPGKVVVITGCTLHHGRRTHGDAMCHTQRCRSHFDVESSLGTNDRRGSGGERASTKVETIACDLQDFSSVKEAIKTIQSKYKKLMFSVTMPMSWRWRKFPQRMVTIYRLKPITCRISSDQGFAPIVAKERRWSNCSTQQHALQRWTIGSEIF